MKRSLRTISFFMFLLLAGTASLLFGQRPSPAFAPGRILVQFKQSTSPAASQGLLASLQARSLGEIPHTGIHIVSLPPNASETAYLHALRARLEVQLAELDYIRSHEQTQQLIPNDPNYASQWHLPRIAAPSAWAVSTGSSAVVIAIADTGVDSTHPDLAPKIVPGWNVNDNNSDTRDVYGHGTKVAGTVAAAANNGIGVASVAWNCLLMPIRVSLADGSAYDSTIAAGITKAADLGARVANVSYDVTGASAVSVAAKYMQSKGGVVTVSAGNYSTFDNIPEDPYLITVGATDANDVRYSWSDYGTDIDVVAPGCVTTTTNGGSYAGACGTSFSAPIVAGVAGLLMSVRPGLTPADISTIIRSSADDLGAAGWDTTFGAGRVNAYRAVTLASSYSVGTPDTQPPTVSFMAPVSGTTLMGTAFIQVSAADNVGVKSVSVAANGAAIGTCISGLCAVSWNTLSVKNGTYTLSATAYDAAGNTAVASLVVQVSNAVDSTAPSVVITSPVGGAVVSGTATITVSASDNVGVVKVLYSLDGSLLGSSTQAPFSYKWNTRKAKAGQHVVSAVAYDAAGNASPAATVLVTVSSR